jgi:hypothetical protein
MQDGLLIAALVASYAAFALGPYSVWPNRWNIVGHVQFGLFFMQYLIPLMWFDPAGYVRNSTIRLYTEIMMLGAFLYLIALPIGFRSPRFSLTGHRILTMSAPSYRKLFRKRVIIVTALASIGLLVSLFIMGFVPMFATDPLQAKYFHGEYRSGYLRAAVIFRPAYFAFIAYLPLSLAVAFSEQKLRHYFLILIGVVAIVGCLNRGELGVALIGGFGIVVAAKKSRVAFGFYLAMVVLFVTIGTLANYFLNFYFALNTGNFDPEEQVSEEIASGAPDVAEGLKFFENFRESDRLTYGAQIVGGLVPFQSLTMNWIPLARYNPGLWAQGVLLGTDDEETIRNVGGGGLRIAVPISGYAAFGWFGVALVSAVAGFLTGYLVRFARTYAGQGSIEQSAIVIALYLAFWPLAVTPTSITWYQTLQPLALAWLIYPIGPIRFDLRQLLSRGPVPAESIS